MEIVNSIRRITEPNAPLMQPSHQNLREVDGRASAFLIEIKPGAMAYRYDVNIDIAWFDQGTGRDFRKTLAKGSDEGLRARNRNLCYDILATTYQQNGFFPDGEIVYDCKSTLYTNKPIDPQHLNREITFPTAESTPYVIRYCAADSTAHVTIRQNATGHELPLDNFEQYTTRTTIYQEDRSVRTFLEMAVAQFGLNGNIYTSIGAGKLFEVPEQANAQRSCGNGMVLRAGIAKGVRIVKGNGSPIPSLVVDAKVSPFFADQDLTRTVQAIGNGNFPQSQRGWDDVKIILQDVRVEVTYDRSRTFSIRGLTRKTANEIMVNYQENMISLTQYFADEKGYQLRHPNIPVIIPHYNEHQERSERPDDYFPIELLVVMPDQRVPLEKMSQRLSQQLLTENSLTPDLRYRRVIEHCQNLGLFSAENTVLRGFGIRILENSNQCQINVRSAPRIEFRDGRPLNVNTNKAEWKHESSGKQYVAVEPISNWYILCHPMHSKEVRDFAQKFVSAAKQRGMRFSDDFRLMELGQDANWKRMFEDFASQDVQFVILVDTKKMDTHGLLKYYEVRKKILTQHITHERVMDVLGHQRGRQTLENILNKTNLKYSGVNYHPVFEQALTRFKLESNDVLILGYDVATPPPMSRVDRMLCQAVRKELLSFDPSVVGITANMSGDPHNFVGDYYYQETYRMGLNYPQLASKFTWVLQMLKGFRPQHAMPKYVFIIRNGLSEGQFAMSVEKEMEALRKGCHEYNKEYSPKFVYILGTKRHFKKFYAVQQGKIANMAPGSVVDRKFVREDCPEFFMQSHYALKGVGKPVEYNVLVDEIGCTKDEVEGLMNSLCYSHQIVNSAVSMPEPIYQADELAKRGRNNYITMKRLEEEAVPRYGEHRFVDVNALNEMLTYSDNPVFIGTRFTA